MRRPRQDAGTPSKEADQPGSSRAEPTGMGGPHGQETAQDPRGLPSLPRRHPRQPCHHRGIDHRRATYSETGPCGSEEGRAEKGSHNREYLAARPILLPRKRARPVREGVVGKGAPTQSHLAGDLLHRTAGSGSGPGKRAGRKTGTAPRTDFTTPTARTDHSISTRPQAALPRPPARPSARYDETGSAASYTSIVQVA